MRDIRRITLISRGAEARSRQWDTSANAVNHIIFVDSFPILTYALDHAAHDVERLLIDGTATEGDFLELLATLPVAFAGDVLFMRAGNSSYLSTTARGDGRLLYALMPADVQFYLETHRLVAKAAMAA